MVVESVVVRMGATNPPSVAHRFVPLMVVVDVVMSKDVTSRPSHLHDFVSSTGVGKSAHTKVVKRWHEVVHPIVRHMVVGCGAY
jgi:hypothetical protein